jgi:hypothetical protein
MLCRGVPRMVAHRNPRSGMRQTGAPGSALGFLADACKRKIVGV